LEGMAAIPEWAPADENHLLKSSSVITNIFYSSNEIKYATFRNSSNEVLRLNFNPSSIFVDSKEIKKDKVLKKNSYTWQPVGNKGGILRISHENGNNITIK